MVYIILLNYNGWKDTIECLESLLKLRYSGFRIIVVDNDSPDNSLNLIHEWAFGAQVHDIRPISSLARFVLPLEKKPIAFKHYSKSQVAEPVEVPEVLPKLITIQAGKNGGFAAGNNLGIRFALNQPDLEFVWLLNNDTVVPPNCLNELVSYAKNYSHQKIGIIGSKLLHYYRPDTVQAVGGKYNKWLAIPKSIDDNSFRSAGTPDYIIGASMFVKKKYLQDVGLLSEDYFLYFEELDWHIRGKQKGWAFAMCLSSEVYHKEGASIGSGNGKVKSELSDLYSLRNRILFTKKHYPYFLPTVYLGFIGIIFNRLRRGQYSRIIKIIKLLLTNEVAR